MRSLTAEQEAAVARRDGALLLAANAGSGKTTVLVERFVRSVLEDGLRPDELLAITFTEKAAGELRARVRRRFAELGEDDHARDVAGAWISTIHGFCQRILRAHAVAAGLDPGFRVLDPPEARALRAAAFEDALGAFVGEGRADALDLAAGYGPDRLRAMVEAAHDELRSRGLPVALHAPPPPDVAGARAALLHAAEVFAAELATARPGKQVDAAREVLGRCADALHPDALKVPAGAAALKTPAADAYRAACEIWGRSREDAMALEALPLVDEALRGFAAAYERRKAGRAALDFADLELRARDLLRAEPAIARSYAERFARTMVDEFQDTNLLQLELVRLVAPEHRFVVGDELQAIYGFRHADVDVFRGERDRHAPGGGVLALRTNFRSRPELLAVLDAAFAAGHGPGAVPFAAGREDAPPAPRAELLLTDAAAWGPAANEGDPVVAQVTAGLPDAPVATAAEARAVARRVAALVRSGEQRAGDVVVLLRAVATMAVFERALQAEGLATLPSVGRGWWGRQEVLDLTAWLGAIANPRDEPALLGALASPLGGLSADGLALLALERRARRARLVDVLDPPPAALGAADREALAACVARLRALRERAPRLPLPAVLDALVREGGEEARLRALPGGARRVANVHKLMRLAAAFEARRGRDLRAFCDHARAELDAEALETDAPVDLAGEDAVRLMTIHAAKGLEFPVVVVADLGRQPPNGTPDLLVAPDGTAGLRLRRIDGARVRSSVHVAEAERRRRREREEMRRVLHVAFTRAEERLILSGAGDPAKLDPGGVKAPPLAWIAAELLPGGLVAGEQPAGGSGPPVLVEVVTPATVADPQAGEQLALPGVAVPAVAPGSATPDVDRAPPAPVAPPRPAPPAHLSYSALSDFAACGYRFYVTRLAGLASVEPPAHLRQPPPPGALEGRVRGTLVHLLLERVGAAPPDAAAVRALATDLELDPPPSDEAVEDVLRLTRAARATSVAARVRAAREVHHERAFTFPLGDVLVMGYVDVVAHEDDGTVLVVDWKTDHLDPEDDPVTKTQHGYATQRAVYGLAALRAGAPAVEVAHLFLEAADRPAVARFTPADAPALEARLREAARGVLEGDYAPTPLPHAGLCGSCPARGGLCSHPLELTDRPTPES